MFNPLHSILNQERFEKNLCIPKERNGAAYPSYISYRLKSELSITLRCWLCQSVTQQYESRTVRKAPLPSK